MANNFISNKSPQKTLSSRLNNIISFSTELRWLVGFFYFSGWQEVYKNLKSNSEDRFPLGLEMFETLLKETAKLEESIIEEEIVPALIASIVSELEKN